MKINPLLLIDFYKVGHISQYPSNVTQIWTSWTPRSSRVEGQETVVVFGLQYLVKKYLEDAFNDGFFHRPLADVLREYRELISTCLGTARPRTDHIEWLHNLGYLPIDIYSIPEGFSTRITIPS